MLFQFTVDWSQLARKLERVLCVPSMQHLLQLFDFSHLCIFKCVCVYPTCNICDFWPSLLSGYWWNAYILKGGICGHRIPQTIWNFRRKIVWERKKYQDYTVCRANWRSFPLLMLSHCNKLSIKTLKHTIFSMKIPHWHQILVISMICALLSRNFDVRIYALFPQIFGNWKVDSADFFTFRMYVNSPLSPLGHSRPSARGCLGWMVG